MSEILANIVQSKKQEVEETIRKRPLRDLMKAAGDAPPTRDFAAAIQAGDGIQLIAEVKKASPSKGIIRADFDPVDIATKYSKAGAACISVLTDAEYFQGSLDYLTQIRAAVEVPLLRKDFVIHPYQVYESRVAGADAVLLIAECLTRQELRGLTQLTNDLGMQTLIELYDKKNLENVLNTGTELIGINNRDLKTFEVDLQHTVRLRNDIPPGKIVIGESGIFTREDALMLQENGVQGMLVGESLMIQEDVSTAVKSLLGTN
ncbi:MAG: indole-3-glycerol phosphate synthase TrpC [Planctomycetota bacterium]